MVHTVTWILVKAFGMTLKKILDPRRRPPPFGRAASVCLLSMTFLLGASRLGFFVSLRLTDAFGGIEISFLLGAPL